MCAFHGSPQAFLQAVTFAPKTVQAEPILPTGDCSGGCGAGIER